MVVRNGDVHSKYTDDELNGNMTDDSIVNGVGRHQVSVSKGHKDKMEYVDKMTDRLNDTDLRLLKHSINEGGEEV